MASSFVICFCAKVCELREKKSESSIFKDFLPRKHQNWNQRQISHKLEPSVIVQSFEIIRVHRSHDKRTNIFGTQSV